MIEKKETREVYYALSRKLLALNRETFSPELAQVYA